MINSGQYLVPEIDYELIIWLAAKVLVNIAQERLNFKIVLKLKWRTSEL